MKNLAKEWLAAIVLLILVGGAVMFGFYLGNQNQYSPPTIEEEEDTMDKESDEIVDLDTVSDPQSYGQEVTDSTRGIIFQPNGKDPQKKVGAITFGNTQKLDNEVFMASYKSNILNDGKEMWGDNMKWDDIKNKYQWYQVGTFHGGAFTGYKLLTLNVGCDGPCFAPTLYRFAWKESTGELVYFENESNKWETQELAMLFKNRSSMLIDELHLPERIGIPGVNAVLSRDAEDISFWGESLYLQNYEMVFPDSEVGPLYEIAGVHAKTGCLFAVAPDGSLVRYAYDPEFSGGSNNKLNLNTGATMYLGNYTPRRGGCGITGMCYMIDKVNEGEVYEIGSTGTGLKVYAVKDPDINAVTQYDKIKGDFTTPAGRLADLYRMYSSFQKENAKAFSQFTADYPILYWQDPLGRWASIVNSDYQPPAECGKPVIYLYPEKTMDIDVAVEVDEFTKTIPEHGEDGWHVRSTPNSQIFNYDDGNVYPYLFWEGHDKDKVEASQGFMIARDDVPRFLRNSLRDLGFTRREARDFIEFWQPHMLENSEPYFFVSFVGTRDFNKVAPLHITPAPDTLIRVFMYFDPVSVPYNVTPQVLRATPRHGFTVFEWGGTSSRPWSED